jgi:hypothetical protein
VVGSRRSTVRLQPLARSAEMVPDTARAAEELADTISLREMQFFRYGPCRVATYGGTAMCSGAYVYRNRPWKQSQSKLRLI